MPISSGRPLALVPAGHQLHRQPCRRAADQQRDTSGPPAPPLDDPGEYRRGGGIHHEHRGRDQTQHGAIPLRAEERERNRASDNRHHTLRRAHDQRERDDQRQIACVRQQ